MVNHIITGIALINNILSYHTKMILAAQTMGYLMLLAFKLKNLRTAMKKPN